MARPRTVSDETVFLAIRQLLEAGGEKAVSFSTVATATGLAAPTLVQRYVSRDLMVKAARLAAWARINAATAAAIAATADKGPQALLKALESVAGEPPRTKDEDLLSCAKRWRSSVEAALADRLAGGEKGREAAAVLFAAWQGQRMWQPAGGKGFRLKDTVKRLT